MPREKKERVNEPEPEPDAVRYGAAVAEIEQILASIDRDEIDIDELSQKVERAVELLKVCRAKLRATELRVTEVLKDVVPEDEEGVEDDDSEDDAKEASSSPRDEDDEAAAEDDDAKGDAGGSKSSKPPKRGKKGPAEPPDPHEELPF